MLHTSPAQSQQLKWRQGSLGVSRFPLNGCIQLSLAKHAEVPLVDLSVDLSIDSSTLQIVARYQLADWVGRVAHLTPIGQWTTFCSKHVIFQRSLRA